MRVVFLGSPPFALPILARLVASRHRPTLVVTPPDRPRGRGRVVAPSPLAALAEREGIATLRPEGARDPALVRRLAEEEPDVLLVAAYGELLREDLLAVPRLAPLNVHPSLLPRWRGATPIQAAIRAGDPETGVTIQRVVRALDAGDVLVQRRTEVRPEETAGELAGRLAALGAEAALEALDLLAAGRARFVPQDPAGVTTSRKLVKEEGRIDWRLSAEELARHVRALNPWPTATTRLPGGRELAVLRARALPAPGADAGAPGTILEAERRLVVAAGEGALELLEVQPAGRRAMAAADFLRGARLRAGDRLA